MADEKKQKMIAIAPDVYEKLAALKREDDSFTSLIERLIEGHNLKIEEIKEEAYAEGYATAKQKYEIKFNCSICGEPITLEPGSQAHEEVKKFLEKEGWAHGECALQQPYSKS